MHVRIPITADMRMRLMHAQHLDIELPEPEDARVDEPAAWIAYSEFGVKLKTPYITADRRQTEYQAADWQPLYL